MARVDQADASAGRLTVDETSTNVLVSAEPGIRAPEHSGLPPAA